MVELAKIEKFELTSGQEEKLSLPESQFVILSTQLALLNQNLYKLLEYFPILKSKPILVNGKLFQLVSREELADILGVSINVIDKWTANGIIPKPFDPDRLRKGKKFDKQRRGRRILKFDLFEVIEWYREFR